MMPRRKTRSFFRNSALVLAVAAFATAPKPARAATLSYNPGTGPTVWDTTTVNWLNGTAPAIWPNTANDNATFGGTSSSTVALQAGGINAKDLTFQTDGYVLSGGNLALGGASTSNVTVNTGINATLGVILTGGFTKAGAGTLILNKANTFSNGLTITGGTVSVSADNNLGATSSALTLNGGTLLTTASFTLGSTRSFVLGANGGTLSATTGTTLTAGGTISGTGALTLTGAGTFALGGTNTFSGGLNLNGGTLQISTDANLGAVSGLTTIGNGATLATTASVTTNSGRAFALASGSATVDVASGTTLTLQGVVSGSGALVKNNTGTLSLTGTNTYTGNTTVNGGVLAIAADASLGAGTSLALNNATLQTAANMTLASTRAVTLGAGSQENVTGNTLTIAGKVSGTGGLNKIGAGTLALSNANNDFTGGVNVSAGTLSVAADGNLGNAANAVNLSGGATLAATGSFTLGAGRTLTLGTGGGILSPSSGNTLTINTAIGGTSLGKAGSGTLVLGGTNTYNGGTTVSAGTLSISADANLGATSGALMLNGGTLATTATVAFDAARGVAIGASNGTISPASGFTLTINGALSGTAGTLTKSGAGTLTLAGTNPFSGPTSVTAGTLNLSAANAINGSLVNSGGTVNMLSPLATLTSFANNSGTTYLAAGGSAFGGTISVNGGSVILQAASGTPAGVGSINLNTGTLSFAPTGSGTTAGVTAATGSGAKLNYGAGAILTVDKGSYTTGATLTVGPTSAAVDASLVRSGTGTLILTPVDATAGAATANLGGSEKIIVNGGLTNTNGIVAPSIVVQNNNTQKSADFVRDAGGATGLMSAASGYTTSALAATAIVGTTAVENVTYAGTSALAASGQVYALRVGNGGTGAPTTLSLGAANTLTVGAGSGQAGVLLNGTTGTGSGPASITGGTLAFGGAEAVVYVGGPGGKIDSAITGTGGLTIFGAGTLSMGSATGLSGAVNVNNGATLSLTAANALPATTTVNLPGGALNLNNQPQTFAALTGTGTVTITTTATPLTSLTLGSAANSTFGGVIAGSAGSLIKQGSGTLTLSGASTFGGGTTINAGTIQLSSSSTRLPATGNVAIASGAFLDLNSQSQTINSLTGPGTVTSAAGTPVLTVGNNNSSFTQDTLVSGTISYVKTGTGTVNLPTANTYTGTTSVTAGTLQIGNASALPSTSVLTVGATGNSTAAYFDLNSYSITLPGLSSGTTTGTKQIFNGSAGTTATLTVNPNASTDYTYAGNIVDGTGTTALIKSGAKTLTLTGTNAYTGGTLVSGGTLTGTTSSLVGAITNNAAVVFDQTTSGNYDGVISGSGTVTKSSSGTVTLTGLNSYNGGTTVSGGALQGTTSSLQGNITANASVVFDQTTNGVYAGTLAGTGTFTKQNVGTVALTGSNTFTGTYVAAGGTLQVGASGAVASGSKLVVGAASGNADAAFDVNGYGVTVGSLATGASTGARVVLNNGAAPTTFTVNSAAASTFAGSLRDGASALALTKGGSKTLTLTGANTFTGATIVNGGTLQAVATNALQNTASITVNSGGTLEAAAAGAVGSAGPITVNAGGTLLLSATTTNDMVNNAAPITLAGGTISKGADASEGAGGSSAGRGGAASSAGLGALTLAAAGSKVDFGTGAVGTLVFSGITEAGFALTVDNWTGTARGEGVEDINDRLIFAQALSANDLANVNFSGYANGSVQVALAGGYYEIAPVPEPATWLAGVLVTAAFGWSVRRRRKAV